MQVLINLGIYLNPKIVAIRQQICNLLSPVSNPYILTLKTNQQRLKERANFSFLIEIRGSIIT